MNTKIEIIIGDITKQKDVDAIVNAANTSLLGGGGVDGAIHKAAGPLLLEECKLLHGCNVGEAKFTKAYDLPCKYIIHTVGPKYRDGHHGEITLLKWAYTNSLIVAQKMGIRKIAFPAISTGIYKYPIVEATKIAVSVVEEFIEEHSDAFDLIRFVLFDTNTFDIYNDVISKKAICRNDLPEFIGNIIDIFEDFLENKGITIENDEREDSDDCILYGTDYGYLQDKIQETLKYWDICN